MAYKRFKYETTLTTDQANRSIAAFLIATDCRVLLHGIKIAPKGSTGASSPAEWVWGTHDAAGTASDDNTFYKLPPTFAQEVLTTARNTYTAEPTLTEVCKIHCHQQQQVFWTPPIQPFFLEETERWALKIVTNLAVEVDYEFYLEE